MLIKVQWLQIFLRATQKSGSLHFFPKKFLPDVLSQIDLVQLNIISTRTNLSKLKKKAILRSEH